MHPIFASLNKPLDWPSGKPSGAISSNGKQTSLKCHIDVFAYPAVNVMNLYRIPDPDHVVSGFKTTHKSKNVMKTLQMEKQKEKNKGSNEDRQEQVRNYRCEYSHGVCCWLTNPMHR